MLLQKEKLLLFSLKIITIALCYNGPASGLTRQETMLFNATKMGHHIKIQKLLSQQGVNVNAVNKDGQTALMLAVLFGKAREAQLLLAHGADVNIADNDQKTALMYAAILQKPIMVLLLLVDNKANLPTKEQMEQAKLSQEAQNYLDFLDRKDLPTVINKLILDFTYNRKP